MPLEPASASKTVTVASLSVTLDPIPSIRAGELIRFTGRVMSDGVGFVGADVRIWLEDIGVEVASDFSGVNGYFDIPWWVPWVVGGTTLPCASHSIYAWTPGAEQSNLQSMTVFYNTRIRDLITNDNPMPGEFFPVAGYLEYESSQSIWSPVAGKSINVTYNGTTFGYSPTTEADGYFQVSSSIPGTGTYTMLASFVGSASLGGTLAEVGFRLDSPIMAVSIESVVAPLLGVGLGLAVIGLAVGFGR